MELDGTVLGRFGKAGHGFKEFSSIHQMDCRNPTRSTSPRSRRSACRRSVLRPQQTRDVRRSE